MDERTTELIAIGASVGAHCQQCLTYHLAKAREHGAAEIDIQAAIEVGFMVEKGAGAAMRKFADELTVKNQVQSKPCCPEGTSCCG